MENIQSLIEKLWKGTLSPKEAIVLYNAIDNVDDDKDDSLKYHFRKLYELDTDPAETNKNAALILDRIMASIKEREPAPVKIRLKVYQQPIWWAAAIVLICSVLTLWLGNYKPVSQDGVNWTARLEKIENTSNSFKYVVLTDGTLVKLSPNSSVEFSEPFLARKRDITLKGEALFKVAKDKTRPFTVYSGMITTTALGTEFKVSHSTSGKYIKVHLYEGKVVVKQTKQSNNKMTDTYLSPGDELTYDIAKMSVNVLSAGRNQPARTITKNNRDKGAWLAFSKTPLSSVFEELATKYKTHIHFAQSDLTALYFYGDFDQTDSLEVILKQISKLNGLKLNKEPNGDYIITK